MHQLAMTVAHTISAAPNKHFLHPPENLNHSQLECAQDHVLKAKNLSPSHDVSLYNLKQTQER